MGNPPTDCEDDGTGVLMEWREDRRPVLAVGQKAVASTMVLATVLWAPARAIYEREGSEVARSCARSVGGAWPGAEP